MVFAVCAVMTFIGMVMIIGGPNLKWGGDYLKALWIASGMFVICCAIAIAIPSEG